MKRVFLTLSLILLPWLILAQKAVAQQRGSYQIEVTAGELSSKLPLERDQVLYLTLSGTLNSSDLATLRELVNLETLDLLGTSIVPGGTGYTSELLPTETITVQETNALPDALLAGHTKIKIVKLPQQLKSIGRYTFSGASRLEEVDCPESLRILGAYAFAQCTSLRSLQLNKFIKTLPEGLFEGCTSLKSITKVGKISHIGDKAFKGCQSLAKFSLVTGLEEVGEAAFAGCSKIEMINIPSTTQRVGERAFEGCTSLYILFFKGGVKGGIGRSAFEGCTALKTVYLPYGMERLSERMFAGCSSLQEVAMNKTITTIGSGALANCIALKRIQLESVTPPRCDGNPLEGITSLDKIDLLVPSEGEASYKANSSWSPLHIIGVAANYKGVEVVSIGLKQGSTTPFKFGLRIAQPYSVDLGNGTFVKGTPGTKISAKSQIKCDTHGSAVKLLSTPAALTSFLINDINDNDIETIAFQAPELDYLWLSGSAIKEFDGSNLPKLQLLNLVNNASLSSLRLSSNVALRHLDVSLCESLAKLELASLSELTYLGASMVHISSWDFSANTKLQTLDLVMTPIQRLNLSMLSNLREVKLSNCGLEEILLPTASTLRSIYLDNNKLDATALNKIYEQLPQCTPEDKAQIFIKGNVGAQASNTSIATAKNWTVDVQGTEPSPPDKVAISLSTVAKTIKINLLTKENETILVDWGDGGDPERITSRAGLLNQLAHTFSTSAPQHKVKVYARTISSIVSPLFSVLELTSLDVSGATSLEMLSLPYGNNLTSVNLSANLELTSINLSGCKLQSIILPKDLSKLRSLQLTSNEIKSINLAGATSLETLKMASNKLSSIDLTDCHQVKNLDLNLNGLTEILGIHQLTQLDKLDIARNNLPFSMIPPKGAMSEYKYNQYWYDIPEKLVNGLTIDLSAETLAQGISDKKEQTSFEWYIRESADRKSRIAEELYSSENGRFTFSDRLFDGRNAVDIFVIMKNPGFPEINKKIGGLMSGLVKLTKSGGSDFDPSTFDDTFEGLYENAFLNCPHLTEILLPKNTKEVRDNVFAKCPALHTVVFYDDASVVASSFEDQEGLNVYVPTEQIKAAFDGILNFTKAKVVVGIPSAVDAPQPVGSIVVATQPGMLVLTTSTLERTSFALYSIRGELIAQDSLEPDETRLISLQSTQTYILKTPQGTLKVIIP